MVKFLKVGKTKSAKNKKWGKQNSGTSGLSKQEEKKQNLKSYKKV